MFFALDSGLAVGGTLVVDLGKLPATALSTACYVWPVTTSLDASTYLHADKLTGVLSASS
jgi:hypothetical protein